MRIEIVRSWLLALLGVAFAVEILVAGQEPPSTDNPLRGSVAPPESAPASSGSGGAELVAVPPLTATPPEAAPAANEAAPATAATPADDPAAPPAAPDAPQRIDKAEVDRLLQSAQQAQLDEAQRTELTKRLNAALDWLRSADEARARAAQYETEIKQAPALIEAARTTLATSMPEPQVTAPPDAPLAQLEKQLSQCETRLTEAKEKLDKREEESKRRTDRKAELIRLVDEAKQRLEEARKQLAAAGSVNEMAELATARRAELEAREIALESQLNLYKIEVRRYEALIELLPLQRDVAKRDLNIVERETAAWRKLVAARRAAESARQAREARREAASAHPAVRELAERNAELAEKRKSVAGLITNVAKEADTLGKRLTRLNKDFEDAQDRVRHAGNSTTVGLMLRKTRGELPDSGLSEARLTFISEEMPRTNLQRIELADERAALADLDHAVDLAIDDFQLSVDLEDLDFLRLRTRELLEKKRELLDQLANDYDTYLTELSQLEMANHKLMASTERFGNYIDEHVLWIRSCEPIALADFRTAASGLAQFASPEAWGALVGTLGRTVARFPLTLLGVVVVVVVWLFSRRRIRSRLAVLCSLKSGGAHLRMGPTLEAVAWVAVLASSGPLLAVATGWLLASMSGMPDIGRALGEGLQSAAPLLWVSALTLWLCVPGGVGESHFDWSTHARQMARRHIRWLTWLGIPLAVLLVAAGALDDGTWSDSLGRLSFIGLALLLAAFAHVALFSRQNLFRETMARDPQGWIARTRFLSYPLAVGLPCALALLSAVGYHYSAQQLGLRFKYSVGLLLGLVILSALASRWFLVKRRNMAIEQMRQRQAQQADAAQSVGPVTLDPLHELPDLSAIHSQLRYLLCHAVVVCVFVGGWAIWDDVLPALKILDNKVLWWNSIDVVQVHEDADGNTTRQKIAQESPTTLRHLLVALLTLSAAWVIARNLPALLEITVLRRLPLDQGGRHAFSVILRYLVVLTGILLACRTMSISWSSVQWLAAGMTVGLGFGLQEIFANFVSGLILLFERPIRVGDVITLGDVSGVVTNIRTRATTVKNWDRKELIVPNKELITGRLLNWTLSDTTNRIVITVGVAYKSDTRLARALIAEIAGSHRHVLADPAPLVTFEGFGDNSLTFVLRCYTATLDVRLETIHELHEAINDRFNEAGIEIAFPQLDLHVKSVDSLAALVPARSGRRSEAA